MSIMKEFETWMELNTDLSSKSIKNYLQGMKTVEDDLVLKNMLQLGLSELNNLKELEELKIQYFAIPEIKEKDVKGKGMYSAAFNKFISYKDNQTSSPVSLEGIVYILSNPSLPGLVKIGQTINLEQRLSQLFNTSVPTPFKCIYAKKVQNYKEVERKLHKGLNKDRINQNREFFRIPEEDVINFLELIPGEDLTPKTDNFEDKDDQVAFEQATKVSQRFSMEMVNIPIGSELTFIRDENVKCIVKGNNRVEFESEDHSLSSAALVATNRMGYNWRAISGPYNWKFDGETLTKRRARLEAKE